MTGRKQDTSPAADDGQAERQDAALPTDLCSKHPAKVAQYYCQTHKDVVCSDCRDAEHQRCKAITATNETVTNDACKDRGESPEVQHFEELLTHLKGKLHFLRHNGHGLLTSLQQQQNNCLQKVTGLRKEINRVLDEMEAELRKQIQGTVTEKAETINDNLSYLKSAEESIERAEKSVSVARTLGGNQHLSTVLRTTNLVELEDSLTVIEREQHIVNMDFRLDSRLEDILGNLKQFGALTVDTTVLQSTSLPPTFRDRRVESVGDRDVKEDDDSTKCRITGATFLHSGECLLCDYNNAKVKLLDQDQVLQSSARLESGPWDIARVTEGETVVSLPNDEKLQYITIPGLKLGAVVEIGRTCWGLVVHKGHILVSCLNGPGEGEVLVLTKAGNVQRRIGRNQDGSYIFSCPYYIALDPVAERLYVSDWKQESVSCLDKQEGVVYTYRDRELQWPRRMMLDTAGNVYVCDMASNTVHVVGADGRKYRTLLSGADGIQYPYSICYRASDRTLVVGMYSNRIHVFRLV